VARWGGVFPDTALHHGVIAAEKLRAQVEAAPFVSAAGAIKVDRQRRHLDVPLGGVFDRRAAEPDRPGALRGQARGLSSARRRFGLIAP
jgi:hypothetical protein